MESVSVTWYGQAGFRLAASDSRILIDPFLTEAAWFCAQVDPSYVIPTHYDAVEGNTGDPGHFTTMVHQSGSAAAILIPTRARPITLTLP